MKPHDLAAMIDHTVLRPTATAKTIDKLCDDAAKYHFIAVCVNPVWVSRCRDRLKGGAVKVCSVIGFPFGACTTAMKVAETRRAIDDGAVEIDMVVQLGWLIAGENNAVRDDIAAVAEAVHSAGAGNILKVILESTALTDAQIINACKASVDARADFVKTSTGYHAGGGATVAHVKLMKQAAAPLQVKASGGIRTLPTMKSMIAAGATRFGTSSGPKMMDLIKRLSF